MPDWYTFYLLMHKLGEDPTKLYKSIATQKDIRFEDLNSIAIVRCELSGIEKATELFLKLKKSIENTYLGDAGKFDTYRILLSNIAKNLRLMGRFEQCIEICDKAIELSHKYTDINLYPKLLVHKGSCLHALGRKDEALELFELACHVYIGIDSNNLLSVNNYLKNDLGVVIDWVEQHINKNRESNKQL